MRARAWIGSLLVLVALVAALPLVTGRLAESRLRELVAAANQTGYSGTLEIASYDRSWQRSEAVVLLRAGEIEVAEVRTRSWHGPFGGLNLASGTSELRLLGPLAPLGGYVVGDAAFATATHVVGLDQSLRVEIATPPIDRALEGAPSMRLSAAASSGTLTVDRVGHYALDHRYPRLAFDGRGETLEIDAVQLASAGNLGDAALRTPARFSLSAGAIRWREKTRTVAIADPSITFRTIPGAESIDFKFGHVVGQGHVEVGGSAHRWKRIELQVTLADISRAALEGFARDMRRASAVPASDPQRRVELGVAAYANASQAIFQRDPTLSLDPFTFEGPDGTLSVSATARIDRALLAGGGIERVPQAIAVLARVSIARSLAQAWLGAALRPNAVAALSVQGGPEPDVAEIDRASRVMADRVLAAAAQAGLIREAADPIVIEIVAREGRFLANGLSPERLAELRAALLPEPAPASRAIPGIR
jgi:hypothetical protein